MLFINMEPNAVIFRRYAKTQEHKPIDIAGKWLYDSSDLPFLRKAEQTEYTDKAIIREEERK